MTARRVVPTSTVCTVSTAVLAVLLTAGCQQSPSRGTDSDQGSTSREQPSPSSSPEPSRTSDEPSEAPTTSPSGNPTDTAGGTVAVPVYYVLQTPQDGPRLVREFHRAEAADPLTGAARLMLTGTPDDPDYTTLWPSGDGDLQASQSGSGEDARIEVRLDNPRLTHLPAGMTPAQAAVAVQQLVYTLQGAARTRADVHVSLDGRPVPLLGVQTEGGLGRGSALEFLNHVNLTEPSQGATIPGEEITVTGVANSFEANVTWEILRGAEVMAEGALTAEAWMGDQLFPFTGAIHLEGLGAGTYTLRVSTDNAGEGAGPFTDDKEIRIP